MTNATANKRSEIGKIILFISLHKTIAEIFIVVVEKLF